MHVHDLHAGVGLQVFAQSADEDIQAAAQEVSVIAPHHVQHQLAGQHLVAMHAQQAQHFGLLAGQLALFGGVAQHQVAVVEGELAYLEAFAVARVVLPAMRAPQDGLDP